MDNGSHMSKYKKKIAVTGKTSRFGKVLKRYFYGEEIFYLDKKTFDILNFKKIDSYLKKNKIKILIHLAGLSRPMIVHEKNINKSIELNIIGTSNVVRACQKNDVKLIFFSTNLVYPGNKNLSKETDSLLPFNNYGWSKLGAEAAVHMYKNSLILRLCITEKPFIHKHAFTNVFTNFMFHEEFAKNFKKLLLKKGIINVGGKKSSVFNFANKSNSKVYKKKLNSKFLNQSMSVMKYNKIINNE